MGTLDRISFLLKEQKKTQKDLCEAIGIKKNAFTSWKNGSNESYRKHLPQIAEYLGVSVDYLLGKTEIRKGTALSEQPLTPSQNECLNLILSLSDSELDLTRRFLSALHDSKSEEKPDNE